MSFNKCLMSPGHFPFAAPMMVVQMSVTLISCLCLYELQPSIYPSKERATGNMHLILKYFPMIVVLFILGVVCSNHAYIFAMWPSCSS